MKSSDLFAKEPDAAVSPAVRKRPVLPGRTSSWPTPPEASRAEIYEREVRAREYSKRCERRPLYLVFDLVVMALVCMFIGWVLALFA